MLTQGLPPGAPEPGGGGSCSSSSSNGHDSSTSAPLPIHNNNNNGSHVIKHGGYQCAGCHSDINDRFFLFALDCYWHSKCLKCSSCQIALGDDKESAKDNNDTLFGLEDAPSHLYHQSPTPTLKFFTRSGLILCRKDYIRIFGASGECGSCQQRIPPGEFVMKVGGPSGRAYHIKCFACVECRIPLRTGDRFFLLNSTYPCCERDYLAKLAPSPAAVAAPNSFYSDGNNALPSLFGSVNHFGSHPNSPLSSGNLLLTVNSVATGVAGSNPVITKTKSRKKKSVV